MNKYSSNHGGYRHGKQWTEEDRTTLKKLYNDWTITVEEIADELKTTPDSVRSMARHLGFRRPIPGEK